MYVGRRENSLSDLRETVIECVRRLEPKKHCFDSMIVRGVSGLAVGAPVALAIERPISVVRKATESSHGWGPVVGPADIGARWIFFDDFSSSGETEEAVQIAIRQTCPPARQVASFFYRDLGNPWSAPLLARPCVPNWKMHRDSGSHLFRSLTEGRDWGISMIGAEHG